MNNLRKFLIYFIQLKLPVKKNTVFFSSFHGTYSDNPKYVSLKLHEKCPSAKIYWAIDSNKSHAALPDYVTPVEFQSKEYFKLNCRAQVLVDNFSGNRTTLVQRGEGAIKRKLLKYVAKKRKKQFSVTTWHGTPLKRISADEPDSKIIGFNNNCEYVLAGCDFTAECMRSCFLDSLPIKKYGSPRNDILFDDSVDKSAIRRRLNLPENLKIALYAPTFRNNVEDSGASQMRELDFEKLFAALQAKFGGEWCLAVRVHQKVLLQIDVQGLAARYGGRILSGNVGDDMAEYLVCADLLITDYSSSMFDFALTNKPCILYVPDRAHYEGEERGFYMDFDSLPFPAAKNSAELSALIENFDVQSYCKGVEDLLQRLGNFEDGRASERVVDDVINFLNHNGKRD